MKLSGKEGSRIGERPRGAPNGGGDGGGAPGAGVSVDADIVGGVIRCAVDIREMSLRVDAEVSLDSEACLLAWSGRLYAGTEDGSIKSFDASLKPAASWAAHGVQVFALEAGGGRVYSASNDGGVRVWSADGVKLKDLPTSEADVGALRVAGDELYAGDEGGGVSVFEKDELKARYNVLEEVKDILVSRPYLMTVRDLDVTITEIKPDSSKTLFVTRHTMEGRAPLRLVAARDGGGAGAALLLISRDGRTLRLHDNSIDTQFKLLHEQKASDMIVTSLAVCGVGGGGGGEAWSGGWDGRVRRWRAGASALAPAGELDLGACVNALACSDEPGVVYAALAGGKIVRVRA